MAVKETHEDYRELAAIYALGVLDPEDRRRFEAHLATGCPTCRQELAEAEALAADLALAVPRAVPRDSVRRRLVERVRRDLKASEQSKPTESRRPVFLMALAAAATLAAIGLGLYVGTLHRRIESERSARQSIERELSSLTETLDAFTAPSTRAVSLAGQGDTPGAAAKAFLDPENRRLFLYVYNLPAPPPGRTYQLWLIVAGSPVSMGTFSVEPNGTGRLDATTVPAFEGQVTVAVTVEPEGGVPSPTGPMVLMGS